VTDGIALRDIYRNQWSGLTSAQLVDLAVVELTALGWVRTEERETGGRPSDVLRLNPQLRTKR
jgi:hypothetical protein